MPIFWVEKCAFAEALNNSKVTHGRFLTFCVDPAYHLQYVSCGSFLEVISVLSMVISYTLLGSNGDVRFNHLIQQWLWQKESILSHHNTTLMKFLPHMCWSLGVIFRKWHLNGANTCQISKQLDLEFGPHIVSTLTKQQDQSTLIFHPH